ncbi:PaaI family thioesterase [Bdellovibrio svalbardensis]|nr:PaaI family thioesterase [Bdellovibrio svalbardensis]
MKLKYDKSLEVPKPYKGDSRGSYVMESSQLEIVLLKSSEPQELLGEVWFEVESAGPPGHVHGGCQAAVLDEVMGSTGWHHGFGVVAAKIEVEFLEMVPVRKQYSLRGKIVSTENRKIFVEAEIFDSTKIYARSKGLFICLAPEQLQSLGEKLNR